MMIAEDGESWSNQFTTFSQPYILSSFLPCISPFPHLTLFSSLSLSLSLSLSADHRSEVLTKENELALQDFNNTFMNYNVCTCTLLLMCTHAEW